LRAAFALTWTDKFLTFVVEPERQPPAGNGIVGVLTIEARWAIRIADDLRRAGHPLDGLLTEVGLVRADLADAEARIAYAAYIGLVERAAVLLGDAGYGLRLGASHGLRDGGLLGFIALNSPTLGDALANIERYVRVTNEGIDAEFKAHGQGATLRFRESDESLRGLRHNAEQAAAMVVTGARELTRKKAAPLRIEFMHGRPKAHIDYEGIFGCPIRFRAEWDGVVYADETLRLPVIGADNKLLRVLEGACRRIIGPTPRTHDLVHSVRQHVVHRLAKGPVPFGDVARHFSMSSKTLERRLGERGASYRALLQTIRRDLAKRYLAETDLSLQQIAYLLGYSEPAPLARAFKRWIGSTPMQYRASCGDRRSPARRQPLLKA
jgi:AraC-like DNA-binding protein